MAFLPCAIDNGPFTHTVPRPAQPSTRVRLYQPERHPAEIRPRESGGRVYGNLNLPKPQSRAIASVGSRQAAGGLTTGLRDDLGAASPVAAPGAAVQAVAGILGAVAGTTVP